MVDNTAAEGPQRPSAAPLASELGRAAQQLIEAANTAAMRRLEHQNAIVQRPGDYDYVWAVARARREADNQAATALQTYINAVVEGLKGN